MSTVVCRKAKRDNILSLLQSFLLQIHVYLSDAIQGPSEGLKKARTKNVSSSLYVITNFWQKKNVIPLD